MVFSVSCAVAVSVHMRDRCPKCGSTELITKTRSVFVKVLGRNVSLMACKRCSYRFRKIVICTRKRKSNIPADLLERYLSARSLEKLKEDLGLLVSRATLGRWILSLLGNIPNWEQLISEKRELSGIMGLDLTVIKVEGKKRYYLEVVDFPSNHLIYQFLESKSAQDIKRILLKLEELGYCPAVIVTDLAGEILKAVREVYPTSIVQGCLSHLRMWLDKLIPTEVLQNSDPTKAAQLDSIKRAIVSVAAAKSLQEREIGLKNLERLVKSANDKRVERVLKLFNRRLRYYHPLEELMIFGCQPNWRYNNVCERAMRSVKELAAKMSGFKKLALAQKYVNALWFYHAMRAKDYKCSKIQEVQQKLTQYIVSWEESLHLTATEVDEVKEAILMQRPRNLFDLMRITSLDYSEAVKVVKVLGLKAVWKLLDPRYIFLEYDSKIDLRSKPI